jgi:hypothetical protein
MKGSGGTYGGLTQFTIGSFLAALATYLFLNSVYATTVHVGVLGRAMGGGRGGWGETTSMGILFVPLFLALIALFYDARLKWAWWLLYIGLGILVIEIFSRIRFRLEMKVTSLLLMIVLFAAGVGLILRSYQEKGNGEPSEKTAGGDDDKPGEG